MRPQIERCFVGSATMVVLALLALTGCAAAPVPHDALAAAGLALDRAEVAGAAEHAPDELARARAQLAAAQAAVRARAHDEARLLAEQAAMDARLAEVEAERSQTEAAADRMRARLEAQHGRLTPSATGW
jgi:septal ring factor EnvC (AmiA/AmiB activator)